MYMLRGHALHDMWQKIMAECLGDDFIEPEKEVAVEIIGPEGEKISIPGHYDGKIKSIRAIYELKNCSEYSFKDVLKGPRIKDITQGNMYAHAEGYDFILLHYFNASSTESKRYLVPYNQQLAQETEQMFFNRVKNLRDKVIADRPYHDATAAPCRWCAFRDECYQGFQSEVKAYKVAETSEQALIGPVSDYLDMNERRLDLEKAAKKEKENIITLMSMKNTRELKVIDGEWAALCKLKTGKNNNLLLDIKELKNESNSSKKGSSG
jgi:hypothetical protein